MMKFILLLAAAAFSPVGAVAQDADASNAPITIVIHGGAGAMAPGRYTQEEEVAFKAKLTEALNAGYAVLESGGSSLDAISAAIVLMEDAPMFNAGKGAVFTHEGKNELDASIMDGATRNARVTNESPAGQGFGQAARACTRRLRFRPARSAEGREISSLTQLHLSFDRS